MPMLTPSKRPMEDALLHEMLKDSATILKRKWAEDNIDKDRGRSRKNALRNTAPPFRTKAHK